MQYSHRLTSIDKDINMRFLFLILGLTSITAIAHASELPPINAIIHYTATETTEEGVIKTLNYQDRWIRNGQNIWSERLIPDAMRAATEQHEHEEIQTPHEHFSYQTAAQWVTHNNDGTLTLNYVDPVHKAVVYYPPVEYGQVKFVPDWTLHAHIFKPASLKKMTPLTKAAPAGSHWYKQDNADSELTLLWSDTLQIPLVLEKKAKNGFNYYKMQIEVDSTAAAQPWQTLAHYDKKQIDDFLD
jgi:hypothetical protein